MSEMKNTADLPARVAILGVGSMGSAILQGLTAATTGETHISVTTGSEVSAEALRGTPGVQATASETNPAANREAAAGADLVIVAVKPWAIGEVLAQIAPALTPGAVVVSVAAGVTTASMEAVLPAGVAAIRAMPNTPAHVGLGVTGLAAGASANPEHVALATAVFETVGRVLVVDESRIDAVGSVSGSGPAYLYLFVEAFTGAAERLGFSRDEAKVLAEGTVIGAARLLDATGEDPAELRRRVTSPKGTTEQAIAVLQEGEWGPLFDRALAAAIRRSHELAAG